MRRGLRVRSEMDADADGFRLERSRVREKMEGDRALQRVIGFKMCEENKRKKKKRRDCPTKY